jgi:LemA protein
MSVALIVILAVAGVLILYAVVTYNRLVSLANRVAESWAQIDVQLKRRYDLIPNLVNTVKGYAEHERAIFEHVAEARNAAISAQGVAGQAQAENTLTQALRQLFAVVENYPNLKANENFLSLQEELTATEGRIAFARQFYNETVRTWNTLIAQFPPVIVARMRGDRPKEYFEIEEAATGPVQVQF